MILKKHNCDFNINISKLVANDFDRKYRRSLTKSIYKNEPLLEKLNKVNPWRLVSRSTIKTDLVVDDRHWEDIQGGAVIGYKGEQEVFPPAKEHPEGVSRCVATAAPEAEPSALPQSTDRPEIQSEEAIEPDLRLLESSEQQDVSELDHPTEVVKQERNDTNPPVSDDTYEDYLAQLKSLYFNNPKEKVERKRNVASTPASEDTDEDCVEQLKSLDFGHLPEEANQKQNGAGIKVSGDTDKDYLARLKGMDFSQVTETVKKKRIDISTPAPGNTEEACLEQLKSLDFSQVTETVKQNLRAAGIQVSGDTDEVRMTQQKGLNFNHLTEVVKQKLKVAGISVSGDTDEDHMEELKKMELNHLTELVKQKLKADRIPISGDIEEDYKYLEYRALTGSSQEASNEFVTTTQDIDDYDDFVRKYVKSITLVEKLAEISTLTGFSRIKLPTFREFDRQDQAQLSPQLNQGPSAVRAHGEGIFLTLNKIDADKWGSTKIAARYRAIIANHPPIYTNVSGIPRKMPPLFFLLHTLAHILIRRLSSKCSYDISALRERIYCQDQRGKEMYGLLIYTAAGDCGTRGSLVEQGKPGFFEELFFKSIESALWCHSDPLCIESHGQGIDSLNLAACDACALLPDTCCEEGNRFLDRAALIGTSHEPSLGFFADAVQEIRSVLL